MTEPTDPCSYDVTVAEEDEGPDLDMRQRLATCAAYRLETLDRREGLYPEVGGHFDMLDHLEGRFFWERTQEEMVDDPPSRVDFETLAVEPPARPHPPATVRVTVRLAV